MHYRANAQQNNKSQQYLQAYLTIRMGGGSDKHNRSFVGKAIFFEKICLTVPKMSHETPLRIFREFKTPHSTLIRYVKSLSIFIKFGKFFPTSKQNRWFWPLPKIVDNHSESSTKNLFNQSKSSEKTPKLYYIADTPVTRLTAPY